MKQVGVYEAKTNLPKLLEEVENGASIVITRHGKPVAHLVPASNELEASTDRMSVDEAIAATIEFGRQHMGGKPTLKEILAEARHH